MQGPKRELGDKILPQTASQCSESPNHSEGDTREGAGKWAEILMVPDCRGSQPGLPSTWSPPTYPCHSGGTSSARTLLVPLDP